MTDQAYPDALPAGYRLHWYVIERVLGQGGFGITYLANDSNLDRRVAIKEYLPTEIARRRADACAHPHTESHAERYAWGLERFLAEARTLARFDHPNIVRVHSVFEGNNTAYMVMRFEEGESLARRLVRCTTLTERELTDCLLPIVDGLQLVHAAGFIHRDIKPENIYVRQDSSPVLLDFGSARQSFDTAKTMTILVAPGYAPLEQYYGDPATQGAWTDIYALGATCYCAIAGRQPLDAIVRAKGVLGSAREVLPPAVEVGQGRYDERLLAAIDHALQLNERDRPQTLAEWRREIVAPAAPVTYGGAAASAPAPAPAATPTPAAAPPLGEAKGPIAAWRKRSLWIGAAGVTSLAALAALLVPKREPEVVPAAQGHPVAVAPASTAAEPQKLTLAQPQPQPQRQPKIPPQVQPQSRPQPQPQSQDQLQPQLQAQSRLRDVQPAGDAKPAMQSVQAKPASVALKETADKSPEPAPRPVMPTRPPPAEGNRPPASPAAAVAEKAAEVAPASVVALARTEAPTRSSADAARQVFRDERLKAAEAALGRGEHAQAEAILKPWAASGLPKAQALLGRAIEERRDAEQSDIQAYSWYALAALGGEPGAQAMRDKIRGRLQPAEVVQVERMIKSFVPGPTPAPGVTP
jgi:serine/threonine protein kinase